MHSFVTRDGIDPAEFRAIAYQELSRYEQVTFLAARVTGASVLREQGFRITIKGAAPIRCRKLLLATGVVDHLPPIEGIDDFFGVSAFQCPYCHGWEMRGAPIAVYGRRQRGFEMARAMTAWTDDIVLCTDGQSLSPGVKAQLQRNGVQIRAGRIVRLQGQGGRLESIAFRDGSTLQRSALFFDTPASEQSDLAQSLGCEFSARGESGAASMQRAVSRESSWQATLLGMCSWPSSRPLKGPRLRSESTGRSPGRISPGR